MKKLFAVCVLLALSVSAFSQFYFTKTISEIKKEGINVFEVNPSLYATKDFSEGTYAFSFGTDKKCYAVMFIPNSTENLKVMVDWLNQDAIAINEDKWVFYDVTGKLSIYLLYENEDWYFSFINFNAWKE